MSVLRYACGCVLHTFLTVSDAAMSEAKHHVCLDCNAKRRKLRNMAIYQTTQPNVRVNTTDMFWIPYGRDYAEEERVKTSWNFLILGRVESLPVVCLRLTEAEPIRKWAKQPQDTEYERGTTSMPLDPDYALQFLLGETKDEADLWGICPIVGTEYAVVIPKAAARVFKALNVL